MFSIRGFVNRIFKGKKTLPPPPPVQASSQPLTGIKSFGRRVGRPIAVDRGAKHAGGKRRPSNWKQRRKVRRLMAKASRRINRKQL